MGNGMHSVQAIKIFTFGVILTFSKPQNTRDIIKSSLIFVYLRY
jgi:hypothetical protein